MDSSNIMFTVITSIVSSAILFLLAILTAKRKNNKVKGNKRNKTAVSRNLKPIEKAAPAKDYNSETKKNSQVIDTETKNDNNKNKQMPAEEEMRLLVHKESDVAGKESTATSDGNQQSTTKHTNVAEKREVVGNEGQLAMTRSYLKFECYDKAIQSAEEAIKIAPTAEGYLLLMDAHRGNWDEEAVMTTYENAVKTISNPEDLLLLKEKMESPSRLELWLKERQDKASNEPDDKEIRKEYSEGMAAFCRKNSWGFVDEDGNVVVEPQYSAVTPYFHGVALVFKGDWKVINKKGIEIFGEYHSDDDDYEIIYKGIGRESHWITETDRDPDRAYWRELFEFDTGEVVRLGSGASSYSGGSYDDIPSGYFPISKV